MYINKTYMFCAFNSLIDKYIEEYHFESSFLHSWCFWDFSMLMNMNPTHVFNYGPLYE